MITFVAFVRVLWLFEKKRLGGFVVLLCSSSSPSSSSSLTSSSSLEREFVLMKVTCGVLVDDI